MLIESTRPRSLRHEYELFVEREIENYKESLPRSTLLKLGDEAVAALAAGHQFALTELLLCEEVDRIIRDRIGLPSYRAWRRRRLKMLEKYRRPEHWGLSPDEPLVRSIAPSEDTHVVVAGAEVERAALYLAANGCDVTTLGTERSDVERVMAAAEAAGLAARVHGWVTELGCWSPDVPLHALVCTSDALAGLASGERGRVIGAYQSATIHGGIHLVKSVVAGPLALTVDELRAHYGGWDIRVEGGSGERGTFLARKSLA